MIEPTVNLVQGSMALIPPLHKRPEVAVSAAASNSLENIWADKFILS